MATDKEERKNSVTTDKGVRSQNGTGDPAVAKDTALLSADDILTPEIKKYQAMLEENPASRVFASLAELYRKRGMLDEAISLSLKGLRTHPAYVSGRVVLGRAYFDKGMLKESAEVLEKVVEVNPDHLMANKVLGDVSLMKGDTEKARDYFERVLALAPEDLEVMKKLEPMRARQDPDRRPTPEPAQEVIEGESLEIVDHDRIATRIMEAQIVQDLDEAPDQTPGPGIDLSVDEISAILVKAGRQIGDIRSSREVGDESGRDSFFPIRKVSETAPLPSGELPPLFSAIEHIQIGIIITDLDGKIHYANPSVAVMHGWEPNEPAGRHLSDFFPPGIFQSITMHEILEKKSLTRDTVNIKRDRSVFPVRMTYDIVENDNNEPTFIIVSMDDLTKHAEIDESLWEYAVKDVQTGLFNRRHFVTKIGEEKKRAERMDYPLCLMVFAIPNFKSYLNLRGDKSADKALSEIGKITRRSIRKEVDSAYRFGEDEFAVILPTATEEKAKIVVNRLREKVKKKLPDIEIRIGTASLADHGSVEELIAAAEKAMYQT